MPSNLRIIFNTLFIREERIQLVWLSLGILVMGFVEMVGIASVMPFLAVVTNPEAIHANRYLSLVYTTFDFQGTRHFLFWLGLGVLGLLVTNSVVSAGIMWLLLRFTNMRGHVLSQRLLTRYLSQPYAYFLDRNGSDLVKNTIEDVNRFVGGVAIPLMGTLVKGVAIVFILGLLIAVDPLLALTVIAALGGTYWVLYRIIRQKLGRIGRASYAAATKRFKVASEGFGGIKDLKILGRERDHVQHFSVHSEAFARHEAANQALGILPRYALESIAFGGVLLIVLYMIRAGRDATTIIPLISLYAFAGYRLIPAVQTVFASVANIRYYLSVIETLFRDLTTLPAAPLPAHNDERLVRIVPARLIELDAVSFSYPNAKRTVVETVSICIHVNLRVGLVGSTGSGKTTLIDILLGLLVPDHGRLLVDGVEITAANVRAWHRSLGYVSQQMYLSDDTIARNIAFGVPDDQIDHHAVKRAAEIANLHDFVADLPNGYATMVGDRGVRLSGGQRQRIAIARALYNDPPVLILDEATSAVDGATESGIMDAIHTLPGKTVIIIAHRLTTVKRCDVIYVVDRGQIADHGTYVELIERNTHFRRMANVR